MAEDLAICTCLMPDAPNSFLEAVGEPRWYWKAGSTLNIHFANGDDTLKRKVADIAMEWTHYANLKFKFHFDSNNPPRRYGYILIFGIRHRVPLGLATDISINFWAQGGGQSFIGSYSRTVSRASRSSMSLPLSGDKRVVLHEFGHALGLHHEHQNPSGGIQWNTAAVYKYYKTSYVK